MSSTNTTSVQLGTFYQFLSKKGIHDGNDMVREMDGLGGFEQDEIVVLGEFQTFMKANWDCFEGQSLTNEDILKFWGNMNTNHSASQNVGGHRESAALNADEMTKVEKQLAVYDVLNKFMDPSSAEGTTIRNLLNQMNSLGLRLNESEFLNSVNKSLMETCQRIVSQNPNATVDQITELIIQALNESVTAAANKTVANMIAQSEIELLNGSIPGIDCSDFSDELQGLINTYIQQRLGSGNFNGDFVDIMNEILYIINTYYQSAGVNPIHNSYGVNKDDLPAGCFVTGGFNGLQKEMIKIKITQALANAGNQWPESAEHLEFYKNKFIESLISGNADYDSIYNMSDIAGQFLQFNVNGNTVQNAMKLHENAQQMRMDWVFHDWLIGQFTDDILQTNKTPIPVSVADAIMQNVQYSDWNLAAHDKIKSGEIKSKQDLYEFYQALLKDQISDMAGTGKTAQEMNDIYDTELSGIENDLSLTGAQRLAKLRELAIKYCDAACLKGDAAKSAVQEVFGTNYAQTINGLSGGDIKTGMETLKAKMLSVQETGGTNIGTPTGTANIDAVSIPWELLSFTFQDASTTQTYFYGKISEYTGKLKAAAKKDGYDADLAEKAGNTWESYYRAAFNAAMNCTGSSQHTSSNGGSLFGDTFTYHNYVTDQNVSCSDRSRGRGSYASGNGNQAKKDVDDASNVGYDNSSETALYIGYLTGNTSGYMILVKGGTMKNKFKDFLKS